MARAQFPAAKFLARSIPFPLKTSDEYCQDVLEVLGMGYFLLLFCFESITHVAHPAILHFVRFNYNDNASLTYSL